VLETPEARELIADGRVMLLEERAPCLVAELGRTRGRPDDVSKEDGRENTIGLRLAALQRPSDESPHLVEERRRVTHYGLPVRSADGDELAGGKLAPPPTGPPPRSSHPRGSDERGHTNGGQHVAPSTSRARRRKAAAAPG
jgi:hypothetical protein